MRMAEIVNADLQRIWPEHKDKMQHNYGALLKRMQALATGQQTELMQAGIDSVILLDQALEDFVRANDLYVLERQFKSNLDWSEADKATIADWYEEEP